ncbi:YbhB/YbcL family Raf kinase inhibitor-like protein [Palleronia sp.]|uniref:YbhB/YbcL family Raf kinase inhibitor-like protein n=1 Tax=Palleronia sp. TaxID=1940284 RepID=UPI0035C7AEEF
MPRYSLTATAAILGSVIGGSASAQAPESLPPVSEQLENPTSADVTIVGSILEPAQLAPTPERLDRLSLPQGFEISVFAEGLVNPRMLAVADDGTVYVTRRAVGDVVMLRDEDGDGIADVEKTVASRPDMHGIAIDGETVYLVTVGEIYRTTRREDGTLEPLGEPIVSDLPAGGQHPNRMVVVGPDGLLYVSVGSTCNACGETDPRNATMMRIAPDGSRSSIFASGLRNTIGYGFEPASGELWGMDHGIDWLGDNEQHEELNHLVEGNKYGWPYVYDDGQFNPQDEPPAGITLEEWAAESADPVALYVPHAAPMQMAWYTGDAFPEEYRGDAYVAMRGSWNRRPPSGYEVMRLDFEDGEPVGLEPFITGFLMEDEESPSGWGHLGRLAGLAAGPDGALYLSDDTNGVIHRIVYTGDGSGQGASEATNAEGEVSMSGEDTAEAPASTENALATEILSAQGGAVDVTSPAFGDGEAIPAKYAAEQQDISPPLDWAEGPEGTQSYVVMVEDPDVSEEPPFIHWLIYDIPADVTALREGVPGAPELPLPEGAKQGANDHGTTGWFGMRPPQDDPAHHYHFQVFALDTMLDLPHGASRARLIDAMEGHVLSTGELVGTYER